MSDDLLTITIDDRPVQVGPGTFILEAARRLDIDIPTLCHHRRLTPAGACRICMVELACGEREAKLVPACSHPVSDGDRVFTQTPRIREARQFILALLLARAPQGEAVGRLAREYDVDLSGENGNALQNYLWGQVRRRREQSGDGELTRCMLCGQCTRVCTEIVGAGAISVVNRGVRRRVRTPFNEVSSDCIGCGSCAWICPNKAIVVEPAS